MGVQVSAKEKEVAAQKAKLKKMTAMVKSMQVPPIACPPTTMRAEIIGILNHA